MGGIHAIIAFLDDSPAKLNGVDKEFRGLVGVFHKIPYCATFGVSCAGHFHQTNEYGKFYPSPYGHLNIIVWNIQLHNKELLEFLEKEIIRYVDASFKKINHPFGPDNDSSLEVWEMWIGANGCLDELGEYYGDGVSEKKYPSVYRKAERRYKEIVGFWESLESAVNEFCLNRGFMSSDLKRRADELWEIWQNEIKSKKGK